MKTGPAVDAFTSRKRPSTFKIENSENVAKMPVHCRQASTSGVQRSCHKRAGDMVLELSQVQFEP